MKTTLILYKSKYGAAKRYAQMLGTELSGSVKEVREYRRGMEASYDRVVLCGGVYAGSISGLSVFLKNWKTLQSKNPVLFCVGASPFDEKALQSLKSRHLKGKLKNLPVFYGRGAWDESKMTVKDRCLVKLFQKSLKGKPNAPMEPWMKELLQSSGKTCDWVDRVYFEELLTYLRSS